MKRAQRKALIVAARMVHYLRFADVYMDTFKVKRGQKR